MKPQLIFIVASHDENILNENLMKSKVIQKYSCHVAMGFKNVPYVYNLKTNNLKQNHPKIKNSSNNIFIYVHHDVFLPESFEYDLLKSIEQVNKIDPDWGVLGVAGARKQDLGADGYRRLFEGSIKDRGVEWKQTKSYYFPKQVETLDELLLITHGDFWFDEQFSQDFYGADICLQATQQQRKNYVIDAYVHHNSTRKVGERTESFYKSQDLFKEKYKNHLPIVTTCAICAIR